ncbi:MAG: response regulator [Planctomycetota bacterium]|nr:response regulator [Planctomycetota bacterium]
MLIADLRMPGMDGLELLRRVRVLVPQVPVMMITGYGDVPLAVEAMKSGAVDFIEKPLVKSDFLRKVRSLLGQNTFVETRHGLTRTEAKVLTLILAGKSNKEMATALNRSKRTNELPRRKRTGYPFEEDSFSYRRKRRGIQPKEIETHRAHVMEKLGVDSMVDLVKLAVKIGLVDLAIDHVYSETPHASEPD